VFLLEFDIFLVQGVDSVNHGLDKLDFRVSQSVLVGDIVGVSSLAARFTSGTSGLEGEFFASLLEGGKSFLGPSGQVNVNGSSHTSSQVGGARVQVTELRVQHEFLAGFGLDGISDSGNTSSESFKDSLNVTTLLHGNDSKLIFFIDPDKEGLGFVVEDTSAFGPVSFHTSNGQVSVSGNEEEVVIDELLSDLLVHASERVVVTSQVSGELSEGVLHQRFDSNSLFLGDSGGETESFNGSTDTDTAGVNGNFRVNIAGNLGGVHVRGVFEVGGKAVVFANEGGEDISEVLVGVTITGVDTTMLVVEFNGASDSLGQSETGSLGDNTAQLVPFFLGDVLSDQAVGRLDSGKFGHC
jgi:hypothetical protein